ncbi:hypothetical protein [Gorillibacterium timonense]|uniref:hypothetical protein n=1 Tax=Gorillibacterium timonense TaxID=1689269 RepID=UPI0016527A6C|nr:hypothetical protein [Gorillibacterium timonense]
MSKLVTTLLMTVLLFGLAVYLFNGGGSLKDSLRSGHGQVSHSLRSFDYVTD